ncbi:unnamed protein product [Caenorhabditis auriculariae]|uniref:Uncharacterized protein n=1 Tax=Caenorhabditis auriculariae TaxID=2777116 RepID=A0A8S1GWP5_9PELO|nr:unnamed protein product [Caenorhabditis auriculariae]
MILQMSTWSEYGLHRKSRSCTPDSAWSYSSSDSCSKFEDDDVVPPKPVQTASSTSPSAQSVAPSSSALNGAGQATPSQQNPTARYGVNQQAMPQNYSSGRRTPVESGVQANVRLPYTTSTPGDTNAHRPGYRIRQSHAHLGGDPGFQQPRRRSRGNNSQTPYTQENQCFDKNPHHPR